MRLAYLILSHRLPRQVARLVTALRERGDCFFIHVDKRAEPETHHILRALLGDDPAVQFVSPRPCYWGTFSIVRATIDALKVLMEGGAAFDHVLLLSGQDYPIKPRRYIKAFLERQKASEFIESFPLTAPNRWSKHAGPFHPLKRALHLHISFRSRCLHIPIRRSLPARMKPFGGSQWWCLSRPCIEHVYAFIQGNPNVIDYFKRAFIPDELFFQTLVSNSPFADRITGSNLTYEDWDTAAPPYPAMLDKSYLSCLASSHKLFARKFDESKDTQVLDHIDELLLGPRANPRSPSVRSGIIPGEHDATGSQDIQYL
jgi:hypothetical protein